MYVCMYMCVCVCVFWRCAQKNYNIVAMVLTVEEFYVFFTAHCNVIIQYKQEVDIS